MINIALICGDNYSLQLDDWHHYGFWKKTLDSIPSIKLHWYTWSNFHEMPKGFDLYFFLDFRPCLYNLSKMDYHPRVLFWWDSFHSMFSILSQISFTFDKVYVAEMPDAQHLRGNGFSNVEWMPGAFYPDLYKPLNSSKPYDFGFIGQFDNLVARKGQTRKTLLDNLSNYFKGFVSNNLRGLPVNQAYNESKILIERTIYCNIGTRLFELVGSGGFCLINKFPCNTGLESIGIDGVHFVTYDESLDDLLNKMRYYLKNEEERNLIAKTGHEHFLKNHTYKNRLLKILKDFNIPF